MKYSNISLLLGAAAILISAPAATAGELTYGSWNGPKNVVIVEGVAPYLKAIEKETNGSITWKLIAGAQLFGGRQTLAGIGNRVADAGGPVIPAFTPEGAALRQRGLRSRQRIRKPDRHGGRRCGDLSLELPRL